MNVSELTAELKRLEANFDHLALCDGEKDESICIVLEDGVWLVFAFERGSRSSIWEFETESNACKKFLELALADRAIIRESHASRYKLE